MPFQPFPEKLENLIGALTRAGAPFVLDLGCGDGQLGRILAARGLKCWGLDRTLPRLGTGAEIVGDALQPPVLPGQVDLLVAGNLFRHLLVVDKSASFVSTWQDVLRPGGWLFILEDSPVAHNAAQENYRRLQGFLRQVVGPSRGILLSPEDFLALENIQSGSENWNLGLKENTWPADPRSVMKMLMGDGGAPEPQVKKLCSAVEKAGLEYGDYWWAAWQKP